MPTWGDLCSLDMDVQLLHLRAFVAVARRGSFTRAAEQLVITQPALTRTIQQLEAALQVQLLERSSRHVDLTGVGAEFLGHAERILSDLDRAMGAARGHSTIRLGFSWLLPDPWAQNVVTRFEQATASAVALVRCDDPMAAVTEGTIEIGLIRGGTDNATTAVRVVHLFEETRVAVYSEHSTLAGSDHLDWNEVADWPLVVNSISGTTGPWSWPPEHSPGTIIQTRNFDEWLESIAADRGIGVVPEVAMRRNIHPALRFLPLRNAPTSPVSIAFLPHVQQPLLRRFVEAAIDAVPTP